MIKYLFKDTYRTQSMRLKYWDYSTPCFYFITICTKYMIEYFGKIENGKIILNKSGKTVIKNFLKMQGKFKDVEIDEFFVMPNHIHGIIVIKKYLKRRDAINRVSTVFRKNVGGITKNHNPMLYELKF